MRKGIVLLLTLLMPVSGVLASGFNIYEFSGKASAMSGAVVGRYWDGSTIFYNPAGLGFSRGTQFYGGTTLIFPSAKFVGAAPIFPNTTYNAVDNVFTPIGMFLGHKFDENFAAGIGITNPFGLGLEWDKDFPGRAISQNAVLESFYISPVLAYKLSPNLSIAGGLDIVVATVDLQRAANMFSSEGSPGYEVGTVELAGTSKIALGYTLSAMYQTEKLGLGIMYRHSVTADFQDSDANFTIYDDLTVPNAAAIARYALFDQKANATLDFPNYLALGLYYKLTEKFGAEIDYVWFGWSKFDKITLDFQGNDALDQEIPFNYSDSWQLRVGAHYDVNEQLTLRAGYSYDVTPQPIESVGPLLPDNTRNNVSFGFGYKFGNYQIDAGYMLVNIGERSTVEDGVGKNHYGFDGTYTSKADLFFMSFGVNF